MTDRRYGRRGVLAATGAGLAGVAGLAGCLGGAGAPGGGDSPTDEATGTTDGGGTGFADHPATAGIESQPALGPPAGEATATIVTFEDPSCPRCRAFERGTVPRIESELVEPGDATFVFRGYPIIYPWGDPASHALEATFARDADAFWALKDHYFAQQSSFGTEDVLDRTATFLDGETDVDGAAVVEAVEAGDADDAVRTDLDAGEAAGASITPTLYLFRDGSFRTRAQGSVSFGTIEAALGL